MSIVGATFSGGATPLSTVGASAEGPPAVSDWLRDVSRETSSSGSGGASRCPRSLAPGTSAAARKAASRTAIAASSSMTLSSPTLSATSPKLNVSRETLGWCFPPGDDFGRIRPLPRRLLTLGVSPSSRRAAISMRRGFIRRLATDRGGVRTARTRRRHEPPDNLLQPRLQPRRKVRHLIRNSLVLALTGAPPVPIGFPSLQPNRLTLPTLLRKRRSILARPQLRRFVGRPNRPRSHPRSWRSRPRRTLRRRRRTLRWPRATRLRF